MCATTARLTVRRGSLREVHEKVLSRLTGNVLTTYHYREPRGTTPGMHHLPRRTPQTQAMAAWHTGAGGRNQCCRRSKEREGVANLPHILDCVWRAGCGEQWPQLGYERANSCSCRLYSQLDSELLLCAAIQEHLSSDALKRRVRRGRS